MFATLLGPLPRPALPDGAAPEAILDAVLELQVDHGLEPVTDGGWPLSADPVGAWRTTAERSQRLVKAVILGPYSAGTAGTDERRVLLDLAAAGCRWIEIQEPAAVAIGTDPATRARFAELHRALTTDLAGVHMSLAITGGAAADAGIETILAGSYASLALDLIAGPDNWHLAVATPGDRGIIAGVVAPRAGSDDGPEVMLWAAGYAASTGRRGDTRVGLATASSFVGLSWDVAAEKVRRLGAAARLATAPHEERWATLDPRSIDSRSAALGRYEPRPPRSDGPRRRGDGSAGTTRDPGT